MSHTIFAVYFSPTHTGQAVVRAISQAMGKSLDRVEIDLTPPEARSQVRFFGPDDVLVFGFPVYAGRIPEVLETLSLLRGENTPAVVAAIYGNRAYDDALLEAGDLLTKSGFRVIAAGAFVGEHSLSSRVATGRPDGADLLVAAEFGQRAAEKLASGSPTLAQPKGNRPYKARGPALPVAPKTTDACTNCMICAERCPMGIISKEDPTIVGEGCLHCCACIKVCPVNAKYFDNPSLAAITARLEQACTARREPELFF